LDIIPINLKLLSDLEDGSEEVSRGNQTKGGFVPQHTDYIFTTVGEEWGLGALVVITLFLTVYFRVIYLAERQKTKFSRFMAIARNFIQLLCKYCMVVGVFPTIEFHYLLFPTEDLDFGVYYFVIS
jgi:cell division protein FtsW (lipid II flippase)